jgi:hypothetical protein
MPGYVADTRTGRDVRTAGNLISPRPASAGKTPGARSLTGSTASRRIARNSLSRPRCCCRDTDRPRKGIPESCLASDATANSLINPKAYNYKCTVAVLHPFSVDAMTFIRVWKHANAWSMCCEFKHDIVEVPDLQGSTAAIVNGRPWHARRDGDMCATTSSRRR